MTWRAGLRTLVATTGATLVLAGCFTGERPQLQEGPAPTGDAAADAVIDLLALAPTATFSASYTIKTTQQPPATAEASVVQDGPFDRAVSIGDVEFVVSRDGSATCEATTGACVESVLEQRLSTWPGVTSDFYGLSQANRVGTDTRVRVDPSVASTEAIAGQTATCVTIPVAATASTYCALDSGVLARLETADLRIELTSYLGDSADRAEFVLPRL